MFSNEILTFVLEFVCQFCGTSYKYSGDLNKHLKIHLGDKIYECPKCDLKFQYQLELRKHSFEHYKEEKEIGLLELNENVE